MQIKLKTETCNRGRPSKRKSEETTQTRVGEKPSVPLPNNDGRYDMRHWSVPVIEKKKDADYVRNTVGCPARSIKYIYV